MDSTSRCSRGARLLRSGLITSAVAVLAAAALEGGLRLWRPFRVNPPLYAGDREGTGAKNHGVVDPELGWRMAPEETLEPRSAAFRVTYRTNDLGFRAVRSPEGPAAGPEVAFVGDSFTFGVGVEEGETFVERFAELAGGLGVANFGIPGFGVDQMWRALEIHALATRPQVVVCSFVEDDLDRSMTAYRERKGRWIAKPTYVVERGTLVRATAERAPPLPWRWLEQRTHLAELVRRAGRKYGLNAGFGRRFDLNVRLFEAMRDACAASGARFLVVHLPQRGAWRPVPALERALDERGIEFLDLARRSPPNARAMFFHGDPHLNATGHAFVALELARFFEAAGWITARER